MRSNRVKYKLCLGINIWRDKKDLMNIHNVHESRSALRAVCNELL